MTNPQTEQTSGKNEPGRISGTYDLPRPVTKFKGSVRNLVTGGTEVIPTTDPIGTPEQILEKFGTLGVEWYGDYVTAKAEALAALDRYYHSQTEKVTRFEVIDHREGSEAYGRAFVSHGVGVELSYQDDGRTLKVFVNQLKEKV